MLHCGISTVAGPGELRCAWRHHWKLAGFFLAFGFIQAAVSVPVNVPFQVVKPTENHSSMLVTEGLNDLGQHGDAHIAVISVVGPYHSGKSFLLNALIGRTGVFPIGRKTSPETMGIWLCRTEMRASDGAEVWLLDSEGFFGPGIAESYDAKVFTIATVLGSHLVYNSVKIIDQQAVNLVEMLARRARLFRKNISVDMAGREAATEVPELLKLKNIPLTWVVEDFVQELPDQYRFADGATSWLKSYMEQVNVTDSGTGEEVHLLSHLYSEVRAHTLFLPSTQRDHLQDLSKAEWGQLTPDFRQELGLLRDRILGGLRARNFEGRPMTAKSLKRALNFVVHGLQRGKFHELPSLWSTWASQVADASLQDSEKWFASLLGDVDIHDIPIAIRQFNAEVDEARARSIRFYRELLEDFLIVRESDVSELEGRMDVHIQRKVALYHERISRWVHELIAQEKEKVSRLLAGLESPMDPNVLGPQCENATRIIIDAFSVQLRNFASQGQGPTLQYKRPAQMPVFSQDPESYLSKEIRNLVSVQEHENERVIEDIFKAAREEADLAVASEIERSSQKLVGKARMLEVQELAASRCQKGFDAKLAKYSWMMSLPRYRLHQSLVQRDAYQARIERFRAQNEQKVATYFQTALAKSESSYQQRKATLVVEPLAEEEVDKKHIQVANSIRSLLEEHSKALTDTDAYLDTLRRLNLVLDEGHRHTRQKNVELWKVHSDEATRCAMRKNKLFKQRCNLGCLFNKVPKVHKERSRWHLVECLENSGISARMGQKMAHQVFEDWYKKELAHDAADVLSNFYMASAVMGLCVLWLCTAYKGSSTQASSYAPYSGSSYYWEGARFNSTDPVSVSTLGPPRYDACNNGGTTGPARHGGLFGTMRR